MAQQQEVKQYVAPTLFPETAGVGLEEEWDFTGEDTQCLTHGLHPYLASMIPQIPRKLLARYAGPNTKVLDPFAGGGAVLVEAYLAGLESAGVDVNPLAVIIAKAKTTAIPRGTLLRALEEFDKAYPKVKPSLSSFPQNSRIEYWFKPSTFEPLAKIRTAMDRVVDHAGGRCKEKLRTLLACVFSNTVRDVSLTYRGEVRLRRLQGRDLERFNPHVLTEFKKRMNDAFQRVSGLPRHQKVPRVLEGEAKRLPFGNRAFDLVITSPPYGDIKNTIPYHQFSKNMLYWLGLGDVAVNQIRDWSLGAKDGRKRVPISRTLEATLARMRHANLIHEAVCFYADYRDALAEIARVTSHRIVIVIGHRILDGLLIDNAQITTELLREIGWHLETRYERRIRKKRISRGMGFGNNAQGGTIDTESILVYTRDQ